MKGYIYIEDSKVVWNPKERPEMKNYRLVIKGQEIVSNAAIRRFGHAFKQWQSECVEVDNEYRINDSTGQVAIYKQIHISTLVGIATPGQKATIEGNTIIDITR